jgi:hypothetical protein
MHRLPRLIAQITKQAADRAVAEIRSPWSMTSCSATSTRAKIPDPFPSRGKGTGNGNPDTDGLD